MEAKREEPAATVGQDLGSKEEFAAYLPHIRRRWLVHQASWRLRQEEAWAVARQIAALLRADFTASQVIAFGSLVYPGRFDDRSDIDLAVSGILAGDFFRAWAAAGAACPFDLDLVDLGDCSPALQKIIVQEGVAL